jgi:hypothetical protein
MAQEFQNPEDDVHPAALAIERLLADCEIRRTRRSGPGGQHRNKVETAVLIEHRPTRVSAEASERRSQSENRNVAIFRLRLRLSVEVRRAVPVPFIASALWQTRCRGGKIAVNSAHTSFPAILAEALDVVAACENDVKRAAEMLACTASQLTKLLQQEPRAIQAVNVARTKQGLHKLK